MLLKLWLKLKIIYIFVYTLFASVDKSYEVIKVTAYRGSQKYDISGNYSLIYMVSGFSENIMKLWCFLVKLLYRYERVKIKEEG